MNSYSFIRYLTINSCGITHCGADWQWNTGNIPLRDHDLWTVLDGHGSLKTPGRVYEVCAGDCCLLRPGECYVGAQDPAARLSVQHIHFDFLGRDGLPARLAPGASPALMRSMDDWCLFRTLLYKTMLFYGRGENENAVHWLRTALIEVLEQDKSASSPAASGDWKQKIDRLCTEIQEYPERRYDLARVAADHGYSNDYFGRIFHRFTGLTFTSYVVGARIGKAKTLLRSSGYSVQHIADLLGYSDVCFFDRQFREWAHTTPLSYRNGEHEK